MIELDVKNMTCCGSTGAGRYGKENEWLLRLIGRAATGDDSHGQQEKRNGFNDN
jgi:hypothetical protein